MATIKDIAREAGVGVGTISRFINGVPLKPETEARVRDAIDRLGFERNAIARGLRTRRTRTVGVVIPNFADIYGSTMVRELEEGLAAEDYSILVCDSANSMQQEQAKLRMLLSRKVDALFLYPCKSDLSYLATIKELGPTGGVPVVVGDMLASGFPCDQVRTDNRKAVRDAVETLLKAGHRRIGLISGPEGYFTAETRRQGYLQAYDTAGIPPSPELIHMTLFDEAGGRTAMAGLLSLPEPPDAVIACNYYTTLGAVQEILDRGVRMPDELALIGFDNLGVSAMVRPPLSIIVQPMEAIGREAAALLIRRMNGDWTGFPTLLELEAHLVLKGSTRPMP